MKTIPYIKEVHNDEPIKGAATIVQKYSNGDESNTICIGSTIEQGYIILDHDVIMLDIDDMANGLMNGLFDSIIGGHPAIHIDPFDAIFSRLSFLHKISCTRRFKNNGEYKAIVIDHNTRDLIGVIDDDSDSIKITANITQSMSDEKHKVQAKVAELSSMTKDINRDVCNYKAEVVFGRFLDNSIFKGTISVDLVTDNNGVDDELYIYITMNNNEKIRADKLEVITEDDLKEIATTFDVCNYIISWINLYNENDKRYDNIDRKILLVNYGFVVKYNGELCYISITDNTDPQFVSSCIVPLSDNEEQIISDTYNSILDNHAKKIYDSKDDLWLYNIRTDRKESFFAISDDSDRFMLQVIEHPDVESYSVGFYYNLDTDDSPVRFLFIPDVTSFSLPPYIIILIMSRFGQQGKSWLNIIGDKMIEYTKSIEGLQFDE